MPGSKLAWLIGLSAILSALSASTVAAQPNQASAALYGALPTISDAEISPNGETVAMLQYVGGRTLLVLYNLKEPGAQPIGVAIGDLKPRGLYWAGDDYVLILVSTTRTDQFTTGLETLEYYRWISYSLKSGKSVGLFSSDVGFAITSSGNLIHTLPESPDEALFARWTGRARAGGGGGPTRLSGRNATGGYSLFKVNLKNGRGRATSAGTPAAIDWVVDDAGDAIMLAEFDGQEYNLFALRPGEKRMSLAKRLELPKGALAPYTLFGRLAGAASDDVEVAALKRRPGKTDILVGLSLATGEETRVLASDDASDVTGVRYNQNTARVEAAYFRSAPDKAVFFDEALGKKSRQLDKALPDALASVSSTSTDKKSMIVRAVYSDRPVELMIYDDEKKTLDFFSSTRPELAEDVTDRRRFDYVAPDGLKIEGYVTAPEGKWGQRLPLIVLPHGGPAGRDTLNYDWWAAFYAANGYAVYQPNFRGSSGYGEAFTRAGYGEWGRKMQDDITNGVKKLIADGAADPDRICIVGASYGGYAALAGATLTPDLYKCAVSVNGVSDLPKMIGHAATQEGEYAATYWETRIGSRFRDEEELIAVSPERIADRAGPPILLIHGEDDTVVPFYQSENMAKALAAAGKEWELIRLKGEDHWLSSGETRTAMLRESLRFIKSRIGE
ncbi:MAG: S9 family peptidase [Pseudomonadota bacterium]